MASAALAREEPPTAFNEGLASRDKSTTKAGSNPKMASG